MSNDTPRRPLHPPLTGPSLSPYPPSLRPSTFHPRLSTPFSRPSPSRTLPTPSAQTPRGRNPFDALSAPAFDEFVDDVTASIRRALLGPERARRVEKEKEVEVVEQGGEDVFGEVKVVQLSDEQVHADDTQDAVEEGVAEEEEIKVHDAYQAFEADRESTASEREPLEYTPEEEEEEDYASEEQSYQDRLEAFSKPACEPAREEEDEYSDRGAYEESFEREEKKDKAVEVIELGSSSEDEEGADELQEYDSEEDLPTLSEVVARSRERPIEVREEEMEEGSQEGDDYSVYEDEERQPSTRVAPLSREESMDGSQEGDDCWIYDDDEELPTSAEVIARARAKQQQQPQDERSQEEYYADLDAALEPRSLPSPFVDLAQEESEELADARVEDAPSWLARRDEQEERAQDDYDSDLVVADEPTSLPSPLLGLEEELREEDLADPMAEDDDEEREPRIVVDSGARIPLVEYGSGSEEGTSERYTSRLEERWGVQAEESDGEEWFGQDASSDAGVAESGSEEGRRRRRERSIEVEKDDDGEPLGTRIPYHLKGKGRAPTPSPTPSAASSSSEDDDGDSSASLDPEILQLYDIRTLRRLLDTIAGELDLAEEQGDGDRVEFLERQMGRVAGMHNAKIDARIEAGESSEEETDEDEEGEGGEEEVGEWEDVVKLAKGDTSEDERPRSPQEAFDEDQIRSLAEQLVAMEEDGRRAPLEVGGEYGTDGEETDEERTEEGRIVDFKLPGEPLPLVGLGGITFGWVPSEEDNFEGEEDGQDDVEMDDDEEDELATTSKYFNDDRSSTSPRKQPLQLDSPPPSSPRQTPGSPPPENDYDSAPNGEIDLSPRPINVDYSPAPDVVSPPPIPDRSSSPLEVFSPPPAAEASSPPLAAADHITFGDDDEYEEGSEDEPAVEEEGEGTRFRRTGDVLGFGEAPEEQDLVVSEDVVLGSSDEERGVESQDGRRGDSSEPLAYESTEDGEVEVAVDDRESSPPRVKNVIAAGAWDPSTPIRFGDASAREASPPAEESSLLNFELTGVDQEDDQLTTDEDQLALEPVAVEEDGTSAFVDDTPPPADLPVDVQQNGFGISTTIAEPFPSFASPEFDIATDATLVPEPTRDEPYSQAELDALLDAFSGTYAAPSAMDEGWTVAPEETFNPSKASTPTADLPLFDPPADDPLDLSSILSLPSYVEPEPEPVLAALLDLPIEAVASDATGAQEENVDMGDVEGFSQAEEGLPTHPPPPELDLEQDEPAAIVEEPVAEPSELFAPAAVQDEAEDFASIPTADVEHAASPPPINAEELSVDEPNEPLAQAQDDVEPPAVPLVAAEEPTIVEEQTDKLDADDVGVDSGTDNAVDDAPQSSTLEAVVNDDTLPPSPTFLQPDVEQAAASVEQAASVSPPPRDEALSPPSPLVPASPAPLTDDNAASNVPPILVTEEAEELAADASESQDAPPELASEGTTLAVDQFQPADVLSVVDVTASTEATTTHSDVPEVVVDQAARSPSPIVVDDLEQVEVAVEKEDDHAGSSAVTSQDAPPVAEQEPKQDPLPSPVAADDSDSDDELMLAPSQPAAKATPASKRSTKPSLDARSPPRRQSSRLGGASTQGAPSPSPEPVSNTPPTSHGGEDTSDASAIVDDRSITGSDASERSAVSTTATTRRRSARKGGSAVDEAVTPVMTASPSRSKRPRASDSAVAGASLAPPPSASPSANKRRRGAREGSRLRDVVSGDEEGVAGSPPLEKDTSEPPASSHPTLRLHQHVHSSASVPTLGAGLPQDADAPASTSTSSHSRTRSIGGTITHLPVTRSNCEFTRLEIRSKDSPSSSPYVFLVPSCALASQAAQETIADYSARDLGPAGAIEEAEAIRLGGGLDSDRGAGAGADDLIEAEDVRSALRRIVGVELWHEGSCELLPRVGEPAGVKEEEPSMIRRVMRSSTLTPVKRKRGEAGEGEDEVEARAKVARKEQG